MKRLVALSTLSFFVLAPVLRGDDHAGAPHHVLVKPDAIKWGPGPAGLPPGAQAFVLIGDPSKPGPFVIRAKMPDGYKVPLHWHSIEENLTILSGTLLVSAGDDPKEATAEAMPAGSFCHMPPKMKHMVRAKGETIIQVHAVGPFDITYVNPADDPRKPELSK